MSGGLSLSNCVWGRKKDVVENPVVSFVDIMSEELAEQLDKVIFLS